ncbi:MAG TPA: apolipoprotein N-acyltransferase [Xanthobacteraceae bacterium]|nr:apolipoprotein N-acyltransferase [Xanthobacteraceae bacterium]
MNLAHSIVLAWGWRRAAIAFAAGVVSTLALAPFNAWPIMFLTVPVLVWLVDGSAAGRLGGIGAAAIAGWWFGFGYFLAGLYWVGFAFLVDADKFGWLLPIAVVGLPAGMALYTAFGLALARLSWTRGAVRVLTLAAALTVAEWLRGGGTQWLRSYFISGFPWNAFGHALTGPLVLAQASALVGLWGMTFLAVAVFASPAVLADDPAEARRRFLAPAASVALLVVLAGYGAVRLEQNATNFVPGVHLRIMQPNLTQDERFNYSAKQRVMSRYLALSDRATGPQSSGVNDVTHLIWPESAFPFFLAREADALAQIAALLSNHTVLITGAVRAAEMAPSGAVRAYNSVYVIDRDGSVAGIYDKVHLVPFGEYLPFEDVLEGFGLISLTKMRGGFLAGDRRRPMTVPHAPPMLPLICYEIVFPDEAVPSGERPGWLLNLTNDGWFGISTGPYQHFQQARLLAIEQGLPLVRAANTGISAVVDPLGRIISQLPLGAEGVIDSGLPQAIAPTLYVRAGDRIALALIAGAFVLGLIGRRRKFR